MKKTLWATVLLLVCAILLSSCGSKNEKQPSDDTTNNTQETHTHSFEEWITIKKTSCTEDGTNERYCACGEKQVQTISAFGHTEIVDNAINSTCQTNGKSEGKHCSVCGVVIIEQTSLPLANHTYDNENDEKCNICGYERYASCKHLNTKAIEAVEATCTASGLTEGSKCVDCGEILVAQVATSPKGHISTTVKGYDSTCKQTGLTDSVKCSICNTELETAIIIPVKPHEYTDKYDESCNQCGFIRDAECAHINTSAIPGKNATCTEAGLTEGSQCTKCGEILLVQTTIDKLGHVEVIDAAVAATCTTDGKTEGKHCSRCNATLVAQTIVEKLGHTEVVDAAVDASCNKTGLTEGKHCSVCYTIIISQEIVDATENHNYDDGQCIVCKQNVPSSEGLKYSYNSYGQYYTVAGIGTCEDESIVIPKEYNGFPVKDIKDYAFRNCNSITSITMFSNITSIGNQAFKGCENLINVSIPSNITDISSDAFYGCANLNYSIFDNAYYLGNENNPYVALIKVQDESIISCVIKDGTKIVCESAFAYCDALKSVTIPDSIAVIGYNAFDDCTSLDEIYISDLSAWCSISFNTYESHPLYYADNLYLNNELIIDLEIPNTITNIGAYAFYYYESLKSVTIPNGVTSIGCGAFLHCTKLESVTMGNDVDIIGSQAFYSCTSLTSILMSNTLTTIESYAFNNCTSLVNVNIPDSVNSIASLAFCGCTNLKEIKIPYGVSTINSSTFYGCTNLTAVDIPDSVTSIGSTAFKGCTKLANITLPKNISSIGASAFSDCTNLIGVYITDISAWCAISFESEDTLYMTCQSNPLYYAKNLYLNGNLVTDLVIPQGVSQIGNYAFLGCTSIVSVTISDSVTIIGASAFNDCKKLEKAAIGSGVARINEYAFSGCDNLMGLYLNDIASWCKVAFSNSVSNPLNYANKLYLNNELVTNLIIPDGVIGIESYAFAHCSSIITVTIPDSVIEIGDFAFYDCSNLTSVTIGNGITEIGYRAFYYFPTLKTVYYKGTESKWSKIDMGSNNSALTNAPRYYYSSTQPENPNNYWHYVDGVPTLW